MKKSEKEAIKKLSDKMYNGIIDFNDIELQLQANYPNELENELKLLQSNDEKRNESLTQDDEPLISENFEEINKQTEDDLIEKNTEIAEVINSETEKEIYPKGFELENEILELEPDLKDEKNIIGHEGRGRHKKDCQCTKCKIKRGEQGENINVTSETFKTKEGAEVTIAKVMKATHKHDVLTRMWQGTVMAIVSFIMKIQYDWLLFDKEEAEMLKDVQPDDSMFKEKSWIMYWCILIALSIQKVVIGKNPELKAKIDEVKLQLNKK